MKALARKITYQQMIRILIPFFSVLLILLAWNNCGIWFDELFTLNMIKLPITKIVSATAADVHPPLYYLLLKIFITFTSILGLNTIVAAKLFSIIPLILLMILASRMLSRRYDDHTAFICLILLFGTRVIMYAVEIRMYTLAMLCVTMSYLYANELRYDNTRKNWILFTIWSLAGAYTHYYAVIAESLIYLWLLYLAIKNNTWKKWLVCAGVTVLSFLPWLFVILSQLGHVHEGWGGSIGLTDLLTFFAFPFYTNNIPLTIVIAVFTCLIVIATFVYKPRNFFALTGELNPLYVGVIGLIIAVITQKFFSGKYLLPGWAVFWLCLAISLRQNKYCKQITAVFLVLNCVTYVISYQKEDQDRSGYYELKSLIENSSNTQFQIDTTISLIIDYYSFDLGSNSISTDLSENSSGSYTIIYTDLSYGIDLSHKKTVETFMLGGAEVSVLENE